MLKRGEFDKEPWEVKEHILEKHLGKEEELYEILVDYYNDRNHKKAVEIAT